MSLEKLKEKYTEYLKAIKNIEFARSEYEALPKNPKTDDELIEGICTVIDTSKELNMIIEQSPTSIFVADTNGVTLRVN